MRPRLYRHHLIGFVGVVVGHFPFAFNPISTSRRMSSRRRGVFRLLFNQGFYFPTDRPEVFLLLVPYTPFTS
jgi:hypothetical protein